MEQPIRTNRGPQWQCIRSPHARGRRDATIMVLKVSLHSSIDTRHMDMQLAVSASSLRINRQSYCAVFRLQLGLGGVPCKLPVIWSCILPDRRALYACYACTSNQRIIICLAFLRQYPLILRTDCCAGAWDRFTILNLYPKRIGVTRGSAAARAGNGALCAEV